jgi:hypothetical protein
MMKTTKNQCSNVSTESYTGKEQSPKRFGLSAEGFDLNYEKEGFDKLIWIVQIKNNRKVWVRKNNITTITHEEPVIQDIPIQITNTENTYGDDESNYTNTDTVIEEVQTKEEEEPEIVKDTDSDIKSDDSSNKTDKKKTDYNIFLKYYLNKLKSEDINKSVAHKIIFQMATTEWARLKKNPTELKTLIEDIKK